MSLIFEQAKAVLEMCEKINQGDLEILYDIEQGFTLDKIAQSKGFKSRKEYLEFADYYFKITCAGLDRTKNITEIQDALKD